MLKHPHKTWVEISRSALTQNTKTFKKLLNKKTQLMAVVKSNAYGHGMKEVVPVFEKAGADWFGVDSIDEALEVNKLRKDAPILILGYTPQNRLEEAVKGDFRLTVYNPETVRALGRITKKLKKPAYLHVKCETGTSRQGVLSNNLLPLAKLITSFPNLILEGLSTHFANIEDTTDPSYAKSQLSRFKKMHKTLQEAGIKVSLRHTTCSAATILFKETHFNLARVGISLYGLWSSKETIVSAKKAERSLKLLPVLTWKTCLAQIKKLPHGAPVSYGLTEQLTRDSTVAILPIGYWDGYDRGLSSVGNVLIRGKRAKILGRVCMNMFMVDVTDIPGLRPEEEVVLLGKQGGEVVSAEELAQKLGTINYEVVTRINPLIPRILI